MKTCAKCKKTKELVEFRKHARNKDGYQYYCKNCQDDMNTISKKNKAIKDKIRKLSWNMKGAL